MHDVPEVFGRATNACRLRNFSEYPRHGQAKKEGVTQSIPPLTEMVHNEVLYLKPIKKRVWFQF